MIPKKSCIPQHAKCVFKGMIFNVYQWEQKMFDGSVEIFEKNTRPDTVAVIPIIGDKILIEKQKQPNIDGEFFSLAGGRIEKNEEPLEAAKREFLEETGCSSDDWEEYKVFNLEEKTIWSIYTFIARNCKKISEQKLDSGEKIKIELLTFEEFLELGENENFRSAQIRIDLVKAKYNADARKKLYERLFQTPLLT